METIAQKNSLNQFLNVDKVQDNLTEEIIKFMNQLTKRLYAKKSSKFNGNLKESKTLSGPIDRKHLIVNTTNNDLSENFNPMQKRFRDYFNCN